MFYGSEDGDKLIDKRNYPLSIKNYLEEEKQILNNCIKNYDVLIEVGCMVARNIQIAILNKIKYIGIDIISDYINLANQIVKRRDLTSTCEVLCINAEKLDDILQKSKLIKKCYNPLFFFPFNSFGNINDHICTLKSIKKIRNASFIIFTYKTDENATDERLKYYSKCNYRNLTVKHENIGIRFIADNGLDSIAYNEKYLENIIKNIDLQVETKEFSKIGIAYFIKN